MDRQAKACKACRAKASLRFCADCGTQISPQSQRCRQCAGLRRRKLREKGNGYLRVFVPGHPLAGRDGYGLAHRVALFNAGVDVPKGFHVHHLNGDKRDNRIANLAVISPSEHSQLHADETEFFTNQFGTFQRRDMRCSA